jgi:hypothetical protein
MYKVTKSFDLALKRKLKQKMKEKLILGVISILILILTSCNFNEPDGKWDDNIKLSEKEVTISAEPNALTIITKGTWWWINAISLNDDWNYDISEIDTSKNDFFIDEVDFIIERKNSTEIHISLTENKTKVNRILTIALQAGNYFDGIKIIQTGK